MEHATAMELQEYWNNIKNRVCMKCIDSDGYGNCLIDPSIDCTLALYLPTVVDVVDIVRSDCIEPYVDEIRARVCAQCKYGVATGSCVLRSTVECPLDRYLPLVIQVIEGTQTSASERPTISPHGLPTP
jgi:hypothetical protein